KAYDWQTAAGMMGSLAYTVKTIFNLVILLIAVVAIIIIMNTLVISVTERTSELGTMRAIGAQKGFVRKMIIAETLITSCIFGAAGIVFGALILWILNIIGIPATNMFLEVLFGGAVLHPVISVSSVIYSLGIVAGIGVLASLYPVAAALRIEPVKAISKM
ncbi:FtsX-like permease family protein, partial [bacterium]|nr:FtsX-like permease family protein [bacterium]